jgi:hypothetical protein
MAATHGKKARVYVNGYDLTGFLDKISSAATADKIENTRFGQNSKNYKAGGLVDATVSAEGYFEAETSGDTVPKSHEILHGALAADSDWTYIPAGDSFAADALCSEGVDVDYEITAELGALERVKASAQASTGQEVAKVLHPLAAETTTGNGSDLDNGAVPGATSNGGAGYLHVTDIDAGNVVVKVQESPDGTTWTDLATFVAATAVGSQRVEVAGAVDRHLRALHTLAGGATTVSYHLAFARR